MAVEKNEASEATWQLAVQRPFACLHREGRSHASRSSVDFLVVRYIYRAMRAFYVLKLL